MKALDIRITPDITGKYSVVSGGESMGYFRIAVVWVLHNKYIECTE